MDHLPSPSTNISSPIQCQILQCVDKPSSSLPSRITFSEDYLHASVGFGHIDTMKKYIPTLHQNTITLDNMPADAVLDMGDLATLRKRARFTSPVPRP
jgi:hypothetical protein